MIYLVGLPLQCFVEGDNNQRVLVCLDEEGTRFEYKGPSNPFSSTTLYGRWTGPAAYYDDLPVKVVGRNGKQTSALDSFSMLHAIQIYQHGHHTLDVNLMYVERIAAALKRGVITSYRDMDEFTAASRIIDSFNRTGHVYDVISTESKLHFAASLGAVHQTSRWVEHHAEQSFPMFSLSSSDLEKCRSVFEQNGQVSLETSTDVIHFLEAAGLENHYALIWLKRKKLEEQQLHMASQHVAEQLKGIHYDPNFLPQWNRETKKSLVTNEASTLDTIAHDITVSIIHSLL